MASQHMGGSDDEGSNEFGRSKSIKSDRSRCVWSVREEEILMATLKELTTNGWKCDNGYRARYLTRIKETIKCEFPNTDICPHPHIYSKITTWKRNYGSLKMMLNHSGIGVNSDGQYKIECDDEQWAQLVKKDSNARYMRNKAWPQIEDWKEVFGNDRAGGAIPRRSLPPGVLPEMIDESQSTTEGDGVGAGGGVGAGTGTGSGSVAAAGSGSGAHPATVEAPKVPKKVVRKRKMEDIIDGVLSLMSQIHTDTNDRLKEISTRIGYDFDLSTKRTEVFDQLKDIPGLTLKQQFYISKKLVKEPELMDLFLGLPEIACGALVFDLLEIDGML
ncbi:hypothetical protein SASPL_158138 [Salvia splendens]|uniref:Myb/SANT-like domain-containing protein n=1 Tax=Salvia splendens TaxID=180675 RepID=A0A8X8YTS9_SALSN|nr:hypothetical protein SASPL_158138 [Salvia splendens]